jgi:hypothetical protein
MKYEIFDEGEDLRLKLGFRYDVNIPKDVDPQTMIQIVCMLVETVSGIPVIGIINDVMIKQAEAANKDG